MGGEELSDAERDQLLELCRKRLDAFRQQRVEEVFAHRSRQRTPISGSIKYRVLTRARGRCECCGAHEHQRAHEVDHIVPKNQGGSDDLSNLQAGCVFCTLEGSGRVLLENALALCIADAYPVTPGHSLVIPRRHGADGLALLKQRRDQLIAKDPSISGRAGLLNARGAVITGARSGSIEKPAAHVLMKHTADQGLVGNALLQGTGTQGA